MTLIAANNKDFKALNAEIRACEDREIKVTDCLGQRYIGSGLGGKRLQIEGIPGNALGAYLDGAVIRVCGNAQDATGDTMNDGAILVDGDCGDATGYAMRGGMILVHGNVGYRAGIHMKAYEDKLPVLVVGGQAGSFLGEYQAGGYVIVLGLGAEGKVPVGRFCAAGMHGGKLFLRTRELPFDLHSQVSARRAEAAELAEIRPYLENFCQAFGEDRKRLMAEEFQVISPATHNPYKRLYTLS